jgi:inhibitor of cysteine peptidase
MKRSHLPFRIVDMGGKMGLIIILLACMAAIGNENLMTATIRENGKSVDLRKGQVLEVVLPASLGTGFSWRVSTKPETLLRTKGEPETRKSGDDGQKAGGAEDQVFRFEANEPGTGKLELQYARPWEKDTPPAKTYSLTIHVR